MKEDPFVKAVLDGDAGEPWETPDGLVSAGRSMRDSPSWTRPNYPANAERGFVVFAGGRCASVTSIAGEIGG